jgi:hypothetical protein
MPEDDRAAQQESTTFEVAGVTYVVAKQDAAAIERALLAALHNSELARRDELIAKTRGAEPSFESDVVRLGSWLLFVDADALILQYRMPATPAGIEAYVASVSKRGAAWQVADVQMQHIEPRRR